MRRMVKVNTHSLHIVMVVTYMQMIKSNPLHITTGVTCIQMMVRIKPNSLQTLLGRVKKKKKKKEEEAKANEPAASSVSNTQSQATGVSAN